MAIGRISGALLFSDLDRQGTDLAFTTNGKPLAYMDFTSFRLGVNTNSTVDTFTVSGTANVSGITKIYGNLVAASGVQAYDVTTGAFNVIGGAGITGNLYAGNLFANNFSGNISNAGGSSIFGNIAVTYAGVFGSLNTANAVITGGYINSLSNLTATTAQFSNLSSGNIVVSGGYITSLSNISATTGNVESWYTTTINATNGNLTTAVVTDFSTGNAVISGGYIASLTNAYITTSNITNFSTGNAVITGGYILDLSNLTVITGNAQSWYTTNLNTTESNITTGFISNFSTGNAVLSGGYISALSNATISTANIGNINFNDVTISSQTGNLILSPLLNGNAVVTIATTSALQLPAGTTAQQPVPVYGGAIRWNNSNNTLEVYTGSGWISLLSQINNQTITPDGINAVYTLDYSTTAEGIIVSTNGTLQQPGVAYTVAGTQITFAEVPLVTDIISIRYIAAGTVTAENTQEINSANVALTTTPIIVDSFNQSTYRSAKYIATTTAPNDAEFAELAVVHMGAIVSVSNVNRAVTGATITTFTANISGTTVRLWANTVTGTANIKLQKTYFVV